MESISPPAGGWMREYHLNTFRESRGESAGAESHRKRRVQPRCTANLTDVESRVSGSLFLGKGDIKRRQRAARCNPGEGFRLVRAAGLASAR